MKTEWPKLWYDLPLAVFDLETTGFDPVTCQIIEIGIVHFLHGEVVEHFNWLIDPGCTLPDEIVQITHITQEDVAGKPKFEEIAKDVLAAFEGHGIVAYNIRFDRPFLTHKLEEIGLAWPDDNPCIDPFVFADHFYPYKHNKLGMVAERLGVTLEGAHRASNDAEATGKVLYALRDEFSDKLPADLESLLVIQDQWERENKERQSWRRKKDEGGNGLISAHAEVSRGLGLSFFFGEESDPLRAIYNTVPSATPRNINNG